MNYKRRKCRYKCLCRGSSETFIRKRLKLKPIRIPSGVAPYDADWGNYEFFKHWPRYHDVAFHTRPRRHRTAMMEKAVLRGADPDGLNWPLSKKPHWYFW